MQGFIYTGQKARKEKIDYWKLIYGEGYKKTELKDEEITPKPVPKTEAEIGVCPLFLPLKTGLSP